MTRQARRPCTRCRKETRARDVCNPCRKDIAAVATEDHELTGGKWVRRDHIQVWVADAERPSPADAIPVIIRAILARLQHRICECGCLLFGVENCPACKYEALQKVYTMTLSPAETSPKHAIIEASPEGAQTPLRGLTDNTPESTKTPGAFMAERHSTYTPTAPASESLVA